MKTFEECCEYLGIPTDLPKCYIRERQHQAAYKLSACVAAWNKQDEFEPDELENHYRDNVGYTPHLFIKNGKLKSSGYALSSYSSGIAATYTESLDDVNIGIRLSLKTHKRAVEFGEVFIETFNELI